jgi:DNA polymerase-3 subunit gamma/tau
VVSEALITKYRPKSFDDVVGQDAVVRSLKNAVQQKSSKTFLFSGPSGTGKTTLARIAAQQLGCAPADLLEVDAAKCTGIDDMRAVTDGLLYKPLGEGAVKAVIVDEFHAASKAAAQSLLKILEEPPAWVYWFLCTTEPGRVLDSIRTRCARYDLKTVPYTILLDFLNTIADKEKVPVSELTDLVISLCAKEAVGSPRQALANFAVCLGVKKIEEARELLRSAVASEEAVNLARALVKGAGWQEVWRVIEGLQETNPESIRHVVRAYVCKVVLNAKSESSVGRGIEILDAFSGPFNPGDGIAPVLIACGKVLLQ